MKKGPSLAAHSDRGDAFSQLAAGSLSASSWPSPARKAWSPFNRHSRDGLERHFRKFGSFSS